MTSLHVAAKREDALEIVELLISKGADINIQDDNGVSETVILIQQRDCSLFLKWMSPFKQLYSFLVCVFFYIGHTPNDNVRAPINEVECLLPAYPCETDFYLLLSR